MKYTHCFIYNLFPLNYPMMMMMMMMHPRALLRALASTHEHSRAPSSTLASTLEHSCEHPRALLRALMSTLEHPEEDITKKQRQPYPKN